MMPFETLRDANRARQAEWDTGGNITLAYAGNELAGEVGELLEAATDLYCGYSQNEEAFRHEVADVIICCDLIALRLDLDLNHAPKLPKKLDGFGTLDAILVAIGIQTGMICNTIKKQERASFGMVGAKGSLEDLQRNLDEAIYLVHYLAAALRFDAASCVAEKFNLTSQKYGLKTKMITHG